MGFFALAALSCGFAHGEAELRQNLGFGGQAEECLHAFDTFFVEDVVDVGGEIGADGLAGDGDAVGPLRYQRVDVLEAVDS